MAVTSVSAVDRANQRNAVLAGFLGWTLDAFDFFILTLVIADRYGRRLPLMLNVIFYALISVLCGLSQTYWQFIGLRMLFGIGMGGEWGVGASLALEHASPRIRGLLSGLLQEGYAIGNLLAALAFLTVYPTFSSL